jgi:hypothetical protein
LLSTTAGLCRPGPDSWMHMEPNFPICPGEWILGGSLEGEGCQGPICIPRALWALSRSQLGFCPSTIPNTGGHVPSPPLPKG